MNVLGREQGLGRRSGKRRLEIIAPACDRARGDDHVRERPGVTASTLRADGLFAGSVCGKRLPHAG